MPVSEGNQSVPTTFDDMFCFNAAVMGLENRDWMHLGCVNIPKIDQRWRSGAVPLFRVPSHRKLLGATYANL